MQKRSSESRKIALSGVFGSLAAVLMLMGGILPLATYVAPALAGILIVPVAIEFGIKTGYVLYAAIGLLSLFVVPDKEMSLIFVFFLGFYPLLKASIERMRSRAAQWAVKLAVFNACIVGMYGIILFLFPIGAVVEEFESMGIPFTGLLLSDGQRHLCDIRRRRGPHHRPVLRPLSGKADENALSRGAPALQHREV